MQCMVFALSGVVLYTLYLCQIYHMCVFYLTEYAHSVNKDITFSCNTRNQHKLILCLRDHECTL